MAATPLVAAAIAPKTEHNTTDHQRKAIKPRTPSCGREQRPPANKKVKLSSPVSPPVSHHGGASMFANSPRGARAESGCPPGDAPHGRAVLNTASAGQQTELCTALPKESSKITAIRQTLSEQFDIEILLKHRELRLIEQEIAKTQVCIEQLRRCKLLPYQSPEISLEHTPTSQKHPDIPDHSPAHWSVTNGAYTRHYRQWLLPDPRFDGYGPEGPPQAVQKGGKSLRSQGAQDSNQPYTATGRPQRQSAAKVQHRGGSTTMCTFNRSDGQLVRMECRDCHRSNFSSAQGFINHCRIAHQREYSSHDAAAYDCGVIIDENAEQPLISPGLKTPVDGPSRNTRQTQPNLFTTPSYSSFGSRRNLSESMGMPGSTIPTTAPATPKPVTPTASSGTAQRKNGGRRAAMTTPKNQDPEKSVRRLLTPPMDAKTFSTPHLEGLLKRKKIKVNLEQMVTEVKSGRINWDDSGSDDEAESAMVTGIKSEESRMGGDISMLDLARGPKLEQASLVASVKVENKPSTEYITRNVSSFPRNSGAAGRTISEGLSVPMQVAGHLGPKKNGMPTYDRMGLDGACDSDASSSDEDDGYKSDADEEMMEVDGPLASPSPNDTRILDSVTNPGEPRYGQGGLHQLAPPPPFPFQAASPPISPTDTREMEMIQVIPVQEHAVAATITDLPNSPDMSRQFIFAVPGVKGAAGSNTNNSSGVLENRPAKMKLGNPAGLKKHRAFGGGAVGRKVS